MIRNFRHRGLQTFFQTGNIRPKGYPGINAQWSRRLLVRLTTLDAAETAEEMDVPGWRLHELSGERRGTWVVNVTGNWRLTFRFENGDACDVDLEDYH